MGEGAIIMRCVGCDKGLVIFILVRGFEFYLLEEAFEVPQSTVAFHWLSCLSLSLAELLKGKEKFFPFLCSKVVSFFMLERLSISLPVGSIFDLKW